MAKIDSAGRHGVDTTNLDSHVSTPLEDDGQDDHDHDSRRPLLSSISKQERSDNDNNIDLEAHEPARRRRQTKPAQKHRDVFVRILGFVLCAGLLYHLCLAWLSILSSVNSPSHEIKHDPTDEQFDYILPVRCHSHNDYWRPEPLFSALRAGCVSVEADVWLVGADLLVGHSSDTLRADTTLTSLYVDPLMKILEQTNEGNGSNSTRRGVFMSDPEQTLVLLIDFKTAGQSTLEAVRTDLKPLRDAGYLTHWNGHQRIMGPITVVASGEATLEQIESRGDEPGERDVFLDAPLSHLETAHDLALGSAEATPTTTDPSLEQMLRYTYNPSNSFLASTSLLSAVGLLGQYLMTDADVTKIELQTQQARDRGLVSRYWGQPAWPAGLRARTWLALLQAGADVLNVDSFGALQAALEVENDIDAADDER